MRKADETEIMTIGELIDYMEKIEGEFYITVEFIDNEVSNE